ncbi:TetR family transcriptional regulator [Actinokineospora fastidiosa]|uniref:Transcriptional regulator, TetR family protein n=1 Tax=Actinokineospora fastidiosa TaxID=1816 RepID=A0A918LJ54_9PSEU|nr:TetR/AcrR family transcriptional regulator [Actinokineospora fastidiosa]GGS55196.1 putative transcriptional regulator, TetR family protein [Actinokineospora fastidiosa]
MPRPVKHSPDAMLDTARALVLAGGPAAASARAVAAALGAPSGSIYHRFPRRDDLVAAAWLRAQDRFLTAFLSAAEPGADDKSADRAARERAVDAAVLVPTWCAKNPADAGLLLRHGLADLLRGEVSPDLATRAAGNNTRLEAAVRALAEETGIPLEDVILAVVDLPYGLTRRVLRSGGPRQSDIDTLRRAVTRLLAGN